ncbi:hypothetical protein ACWGM4_04035 [Streptomyces albidoflavus]|uniref:hypothetical protein n=1 Tax=Streptomyces sp. CAI-17 TaxID=1169742 RepID=UPI0008F48138
MAVRQLRGEQHVGRLVAWAEGARITRQDPSDRSLRIHGAYESLTGSGIASGPAFRAGPRTAAAALRNWSTEQTRTGRTGYALVTLGMGKRLMIGLA